MNIAFHTLGCKVNQFETQALELMLAERNHKIVSDFTVADVIVVNTCTVTSTSDQKSRRIIRHFAKEYPKAKLAVCGCLSQMSPDTIKEIDNVAIIAGTSDKTAFVEKIDNLFAVNEYDLTVDEPLKRRIFELLPAGGLSGHTRAMLKIEDGCSNFCTYCIIPYSRGPVRSMPISNALSECERLQNQGYKEIVLTGIEISSYGKDLTPKSDITELVAVLCENFPKIRFRLGSLEPRTITENFCNKLKNSTNLCPHFHLSLQSGCNSTLSRMHRKYNTERYFESVNLLNLHFPNCAITTDIIVGFPGEDDIEFSESLTFIKKCNFASMHIFPYSRRAGTPADKMDNQVPKQIKSQRAKQAAEIATKLESEYLKKQVNTIQSVIFEEEADHFWCGHARNYVKVYVKSADSMHNIESNVKIISLFRDGLLAELL